MQLARKLGMITYRSSKEWQQRFGRERVAEATRRQAHPLAVTDATRTPAGRSNVEMSHVQLDGKSLTGHSEGSCARLAAGLAGALGAGTVGLMRTLDTARFQKSPVSC